MTSLYNEISQTYLTDGYVIVDSHQVALDQLNQHAVRDKSELSVIDFGVGHGTFLKDLHSTGRFGKMTGVDISARMLETAVNTVPMDGIVSEIDKIDQHIPTQSVDIAVAHFVLAYVPLETVLEQANQVLVKDGYLSLVTTTNEEGLTTGWVYPLLDHCKASFNPLLRLVPFLAYRAIPKVKAPENFASIEQSLIEGEFEIIDRQQQRFTRRLETPAEGYSVLIEQGWCVKVIDLPGVPFSLLKMVARYIINRLPFPILGTQVVETILLRRIRPDCNLTLAEQGWKANDASQPQANYNV